MIKFVYDVKPMKEEMVCSNNNINKLPRLTAYDIWLFYCHNIGYYIKLIYFYVD